MNTNEYERKLAEAVIDYGIDYSSSLERIAAGIKRISIDNVSLSGLRAALMSVGKILEEYSNEGYYLAIVSPGSNKTIVLGAIHDTNLEIMAYAKEGLIKQNSTGKAIDIFKKEFTTHIKKQ